MEVSTIGEYLTVKEVMEELKVSRKTVERWMNAGELTRIKLGEGTVRIDRKDLDEFVERRKK